MSVAINNKTRLSQVGEFSLIDLIRKGITKNKSVIEGIGDDTAVLPLNKNNYLLYTTDMLVQGTHFTRKSSAAKVGRKAMACSVSDIAAMGGTPSFAVVSLGAPQGLNVQWIRQLYQGMNALAKRFHVSIVGGDTVKSKMIVINVALLGTVQKKDLVTRNGACVGDHIFMTGKVGGSLKSGRHLNFTPRVNESQFLVKKFKPSAMIDVSDGLAADLTHLTKAAKAGACLNEELIPRHKSSTLLQALHDGEDFELLFTVSKRKADQLKKGKHRGMTFYHIGEITKTRSICLVNRKGQKKRISARGFTHFKNR